MHSLDHDLHGSSPWRHSLLRQSFLLLLFLSAPLSCDNRPVNLDPDSGVQLIDGLSPRSDRPLTPVPAPLDAGATPRCVVATRALPCNFEYVAATVEEVLEDGCLSSPEVPHDTLQDCEIVPFPCDSLPPAGPPSRLVGPAPDHQSCVFIHECVSINDCVVAEDCRDPDGCCGCGEPFPLALVERDDCLVGPVDPLKKPGPMPPEGCGSRCPDVCWGWAAERPADPVPLSLVCQPNPDHSTLNRCTMAPDWTLGYLLWQAPLDATSQGPALEIFADGRIRQWQNAPRLTPRQTSGWDSEIMIQEYRLAKLFDLLGKVDTSKLPHTNITQVGCSPSLYFQSCPACEPVELEYQSANNLQPEMDQVYAWFYQQDFFSPGELPPAYCGLEAKATPCGGSTCDTATEICVINVGWVEDHYCSPLPPACQDDRSCACAGEVCKGGYTFCVDQPQDNTISCECTDC